MATDRKRLQVLLTPEQYEALRDVMRARRYTSMSQLAAEILIEACGLPGDAPQRGKYSRFDMYPHAEDNPVTEIRQTAYVDGYVAGNRAAAQGFAPSPFDDEEMMPPEALLRLKNRQRIPDEE